MLLDKFERFAQAHPIEIVSEHWISIGWQSRPELLDPFRSLLQFGQMFAWILISKLMIGDHGKSIPQRPREDNVILVHGWKVSPGRHCIQGVFLISGENRMALSQGICGMVLCPEGATELSPPRVSTP
jgi:hypothetical protein